ncbi:MliC family protein [Qingshengfaniella alkalisoli]|uniref:DUF1311 domain-containing protein n=1 Tax=Qingshengfaniella alkalisoli TaxID=2599296 RepID=A0A5B8I800_9RHOB|nr:MliC family protein [Qingshengfaniella alkalisoli]QDY70025.1 DUF1311 domain-containing protein [Qingshengfaniella alkalisoli]
MQRLMIVALFVVAASGVQAQDAGPGFDCEKASRDSERMICDDPLLSALDHEMSRTYTLAVETPDMDPDRLNELQAMQRDWIKRRDACDGKAEDPRGCMISEYGMRMYDLRQRYANARSDDDAGITIGPLPLECGGLDQVPGVLFINGPESMATVHHDQTWATLVQERAASGVKYTGSAWNGDYLLWTKGDAAQLALPDADQVDCLIGEAG